MNFIIVIAIIAVIAMFIFWTGFRSWVIRQLNSIERAFIAVMPAVTTWLRNALRVIIGIIGTYALILGIASLLALILIIIALLIKAPGFTAFAFVLAISAVLLAWMPAGIVLRVFRVTDAVIPKAMKTFIAWVAFVGFLGLTMPDVLTFKSLLGAALIGFIMLGVTSSINVLDKIIFPFVLLMCLTIAWKYFFPEDFRSTTRYVVSWSKRANTAKDRSAINNEMNAATTYGVILRDINILYKDTASLAEEKHPLLRGTIIKFVSHKQEVCVIDGQGFVQIQLSKANGSFVKGEKRWIEAEFVQIATPREIVPEDDSLLPSNQNQQPSVTQTSMVKDSIFTKGVYDIDVNGETPFTIRVVSAQECDKYLLASQTGNGYDIVFADGTLVHDAPNIQTKSPHYETPRFRLKSTELVTIKMIVN